MICPFCGKKEDCVVYPLIKSTIDYRLSKVLHNLQFQIDELKKYVHKEVFEEIQEKVSLEQ
jgi:hemerythrin-like domain-containing protein